MKNKKNDYDVIIFFKDGNDHDFSMNDHTKAQAIKHCLSILTKGYEMRYSDKHIIFYPYHSIKKIRLKKKEGTK